MRISTRGGADREDLTAEIERAARLLAAAGVESARLDAEVLAAEAAGGSRAQVVAGGLKFSQGARERFRAMVSRRERREPLAYIVGRKEFFSLDFEVNPAVLIPRPETETLVSAALEFLSKRRTSRVLEIGTGSGCIAIAIAVDAPDVSIVASDISASALEVAARNAARLGCGERIRFVRADLFQPFACGPGAPRYDLVLSNPPYVDGAAVAALAPEIVAYEPRIALTGGAGALHLYPAIAAGAKAMLKPDGALMVEAGVGQTPRVCEIFSAAGFTDLATREDLGGLTRMVAARLEVQGASLRRW